MIGSIRLPVNARRAANYLCLLGYAFIAQMSVTMTAMADSPETPSSTPNAVSIVTLGLDGTTWDKLLIWALGLAALVAGAVVVTTAGSIITHKREAEAAEASLERYKETVAGRVADAKTEGIRAGETAGNALERAGRLEKEAAEARERAANVELQLEQLRLRMQPRRFDVEKSVAMLAGKKKARVEIYFLESDADAFYVALQLNDILHKAGWDVEQPKKIPAHAGPSGDMIPSTIAIGGQTTGISINRNEATAEDQAYFMNGTVTDEPLISLLEMISAAKMQVASTSKNDLPPDLLRIVVSARG